MPNYPHAATCPNLLGPSPLKRARLIRARRQLVSAKARIAEELTFVVQQQSIGLHTPQAEAMLRHVEASLGLMDAYGDIIEELLVRHDAESIAEAAISASLVR